MSVRDKIYKQKDNDKGKRSAKKKQKNTKYLKNIERK